ncbi:MAG: HEAT repeat domain-containing protein, partial [Sphingomonas sp.]|nr:HEAT repeat domain-containing protein [Sphingomonas sp.]
LIALTRDEHSANRDWATLLLAQQDTDTAEVREALLGAAEDENEYVRAEAILGLAQRDKALALPLLQRELGHERVAVPLFEAAALVADPSRGRPSRFCAPFRRCPVRRACN